MVVDSCHREKNVQNREKTFGIEKKNLEYRKMFQGQKKIVKSRKIKIKIEKKHFGIEKNISESRKLFQNR